MSPLAHVALAFGFDAKRVQASHPSNPVNLNWRNVMKHTMSRRRFIASVANAEDYIIRQSERFMSTAEPFDFWHVEARNEPPAPVAQTSAMRLVRKPGKAAALAAL